MFDVLIRRWWIVAARGVVAIGLGAALFIARVETLGVLVSFFGGIALADGVFAAGAGLAIGWMPLFLEGVVGLTIGAFTMLFPDAVDLWFVPLIVLWAIVTGGLGGMAAGGLRRVARPSMVAGERLLIGYAVLSVAFGLIFAWRPGLGALTGLVGSYALVSGVLLVAFALNVRHWPTALVSSDAVTLGAPASPTRRVG